VPEGQAVLFITRVGYLESGVAVELTHSYCRSDYYDFVAERRLYLSPKRRRAHNRLIDTTIGNSMKTKYTPSFIFGAARVDAATAQSVLEQCQFQVKLALVVLLKQQTIEQAQLMLDRANGDACAVLKA
jgi:hypothetical protein